jgi:Sulfatase-modifying factor enzyme 1
MIAVSWQEAGELCAKLSTAGVRYRLPTEAEWEKAASNASNVLRPRRRRRRVRRRQQRGRERSSSSE